MPSYDIPNAPNESFVEEAEYTPNPLNAQNWLIIMRDWFFGVVTHETTAEHYAHLGHITTTNWAVKIRDDMFARPSIYGLEDIIDSFTKTNWMLKWRDFILSFV